MTGKGFPYSVTEESLKKWMRMPAEMKLEWLEEINEFVLKYAPEKNKIYILCRSSTALMHSSTTPQSFLHFSSR